MAMVESEKANITPKQKKVAEMLADFCEPMTYSEIIEESKISKATFNKWIGDRNFTEYTNSLVEKYTDIELCQVYKALCKKAKSGDVSAMKLFFEMKGKYKNQVEFSGDITFIDDVNE